MLITLAPVLNPHWMGQSVFAERYLYLPSVGFCWVVAAGLVHLYRNFNRLPGPVPRTVMYAAAGVLAALCAIRIVSRNLDWRNEVVFYTRTLADAPDLPPVNELRLSLEAAYAKQGDLSTAEVELRFMLASEPDNIRVLSDLGAVLMGQRRLVEARDLLLRAIKIDPSYSNARANVGEVYLRMNRLEQAETEFRAATQLEPTYAVSYAYANLGEIHAHKGDRAQAEKAYKNALSINASNRDAHCRLGALYADTGRNVEATREFKTVLESDPGNAAALAGLRRVLIYLPQTRFPCIVDSWIRPLALFSKPFSTFPTQTAL